MMTIDDGQHSSGVGSAEPGRRLRRIGLLTATAGPGVVWFVAWVTADVGKEASNGLELANVALLLAAVTVFVALLNWIGGLFTSIASALALNWYHTAPFRTFRIAGGEDVTSVVLLGSLGLGVSSAMAVRARRAARAGRRLGMETSRNQLALRSGEARPVHELWHAAIGATSADLGFVLASVVDEAPRTIPVIGRRAWTDEDQASSFVLPATGAAFAFNGRHPRWLVLTPTHGMGPLSIDRRAVAAFADALELAS
jgi:hypothetical protein